MSQWEISMLKSSLLYADSTKHLFELDDQIIFQVFGHIFGILDGQPLNLQSNGRRTFKTFRACF